MIVQLFIIHSFTFFLRMYNCWRIYVYVDTYVLYWPKSLFQFLHNILKKIPNELSGYPNICFLSVFLKSIHTHIPIHTYTHIRATHFHFSLDIYISTCTCQCRIMWNTVTNVYELPPLSRWPVLEATCPLSPVLRPIQAISNVHNVLHSFHWLHIGNLAPLSKADLLHSLIDALELCWRRRLRVPWTARSNQSIPKEINPEYSLEGLMLKLKLQHFGHLMWRADSREKTLMLVKTGGKRRRGQQWVRWLDGITVSMHTLGDSGGQGSLACCSPWGHGA